MTELHPPQLTLLLSWRKSWHLHCIKGLSTREAGRGHATPHMPVETAKCWWLLKIVWAGGNGSCAVCVDLQAVGALEFFGELYSLAKGFGPFLRGVWAGFREREGSIFSNHQHFAVSTGICGVACPLPASRVDKPLTASRTGCWLRPQSYRWHKVLISTAHGFLYSWLFAAVSVYVLGIKNVVHGFDQPCTCPTHASAILDPYIVRNGAVP